MAFHDWTSFFHMGGYAAYVWPAYASVCVIALYFIGVVRYRLKQLLATAKV